MRKTNLALVSSLFFTLGFTQSIDFETPSSFPEDWYSYTIPSVSTLIPNVESHPQYGAYDDPNIVSSSLSIIAHGGQRCYVFNSLIQGESETSVLMYKGLPSNYGAKKVSFWVYKNVDYSMSLSLVVIDSYNSNTVQPLDAIRVTSKTPFKTLTNSPAGTWTRYEYNIPNYEATILNPELAFFDNAQASEIFWIDDVSIDEGSVSQIDDSKFENYFKIFQEGKALKLALGSSEIKNFNVNVYSMLGQNVLSSNSTEIGDVSPLKSGIYNVKISFNNHNYQKKIFIQN